MRCAVAARKKVGGTDEGADGVMHGLCGGGLLACDRRGWGGMKPDKVCGSVSLDDQGHSPHPRGEDLLRQLYAYDGIHYRI
jgi:hypothetical protein